MSIKYNQVNYINIHTFYMIVQKLIKYQSPRKHVINIHLYVENFLMLYTEYSRLIGEMKCQSRYIMTEKERSSVLSKQQLLTLT